MLYYLYMADCVNRYDKKDLGYSKKDSNYSKKSSSYSNRCLDYIAKIFQEGSPVVYQNNIQIIYNLQ